MSTMRCRAHAFYPAGSTTRNVSAFYDNYGRTTEIDDGAGARAFSYDDLNETLTVTTAYLVVPGAGGNVNPATLPARTITYMHCWLRCSVWPERAGRNYLHVKCYATCISLSMIRRVVYYSYRFFSLSF